MTNISEIKQQLKPDVFKEDKFLKLIIEKAQEKKISDDNTLTLIKKFIVLVEHNGLEQSAQTILEFINSLNNDESKASVTTDYIESALRQNIQSNRTKITHEPKARLVEYIKRLISKVAKCSATVGGEDIDWNDSSVKSSCKHLSDTATILEDKSIALSESLASSKENFGLEVKCR